MGNSTIVTIDYKNLPRLFCFSLGGLCSLLVAVLLYECRLTSLAEQQSQDYGTALARMASHQAVDATLNHDLVSLQVILQDIASNPGVLLATIHDVGNNLLVQAGSTTLARTADAPSIHTAPIRLHDSIAGYVTVILAGANIHSAVLLVIVIIMALLLILAGGWSLHENRARLFLPKAPPAPDDDDDDDDEQGAAPPAEPFTALARLHVVNLTNLRQQLTADVFLATNENLNRLLGQVLALYNGHRVASEQDEYVLQFDSLENPADAVFRAACSLYLILRLAGHLSPAPLTLGGELRLGHTAFSSKEEIAPGELTLEEEAAKLSLPQGLELARQEDRHVLKGFRQPVAALLEKQYQHLLGALKN